MDYHTFDHPGKTQATEPVIQTHPASFSEVLVLAEDSALADRLCSELSTGGVQAAAAASVQGLLELLRRRPPRALLVDLDLFPEPPWDLLQALKQAAGPAPILAISSRFRLPREVVTALKRGATEFTPKPVDARVAAARLMALLRAGERSRRPKALSRLHADGATVELDQEARRCQLIKEGRSEEVRLSPMELSLLALFLANPSRLLSKGELVRALWPGSAEVPHGGTLAHFIARLRRKLGPAGNRIRTVWGAGYRLDVEGRS